ncbi:MAG TPA: hypothetical protein VFS39_02310 [Nitrospira sp.]|nr:hypothetical protein [Nitrospira sp.]
MERYFKPSQSKSVHQDLNVAHSISGRIRLRAPKLQGRPKCAEEVGRRLSAIRGMHTANANPTTGSITMNYNPSALDSMVFLAEVAAALGLVAAGLDPRGVEAMFKVLGVSPAEIRRSFDGIGLGLVIPIAIFAMGFYAGRQLG